MEEFPTSDDEFDLMYGDDLDVLREQEDTQKTQKKSRKSLDFTQNDTETPCTVQSHDFTRLETDSSHSNKRTIEELFGDIDDILYEKQAKRVKNNDKNEDLALIDHIVELRRLARENGGLEGLRRDYTTVGTRDRNNVSLTAPTYPFIGVTRPDNQRVYVRFHSEEFEAEERHRIVSEVTQNGGLTSNSQLWSEAQELLTRQTLPEPEAPISTQQKELWVDLYKPRKYFELLSDESTNRVMLRWMKLWDKVVFQRRPKINPKNKDLKTDLDEHGRPFYKVALLCGPPGLGKTTLAHMVAKHAGYNVVEINASDDRSLEAFKTSLENATQMRSVLDVERRPNCLVFDEIDGAPAASIEFLVKAVTAPQKKKTVRRPIICICNDAYVPALRPLRQIAFVVNFPPTCNTRLAERLVQIAKWQHVATDMGAMLALAEKSQNDIRSCLSVLHIFKAQNKPVMLSDVVKTSLGQKDTQKGIFSVWQDIFFVDKKKKESLKDRARKILDVVNSFGDYEKVAQGIFENFVKFDGLSLAAATEAAEWFSFSDLVNQEVFSRQSYGLMSYLQYAFVGWHFAFGKGKWQKLQLANAGFEVKMKQKRQKAIIGELLRGMQPGVRSYVHSLSLVLDIVPLLIYIISPSFRPISLHLYTEEEKSVLDKVVKVMIDYNLNYVQERTADGTYVYKLDPALDQVVSFVSPNTLSYSNKQLIAQEIETVKMKRCEVAAPVAASRQKCVSRPQVPAVVKDFFGRTMSKKSPSGKQLEDTKNDIWYQYKEGYNNAVRKTIKISTLK